MRGATLPAAADYPCFPISIHAPHAGSDLDDDEDGQQSQDFNPRSPCGERLFRHTHISLLAISIHAPHAGSDFVRQSCRFLVNDFNPRSPCGERRAGRSALPAGQEFQSTLPMRGATARCGGIRNRRRFQSTLPMRGATCW